MKKAKTLEELLQEKFDSIVPPPRLSYEKSEVWKAGVRRSIQAVNAALREYNKGDHHEES